MKTLDAKVGFGAADWGLFSPLSLRTWLLLGQDEDRPEGDTINTREGDTRPVEQICPVPQGRAALDRNQDRSN